MQTQHLKNQTNAIMCIYHANCADGFGAAWVVRKALGPDVEFHGAHYGDKAPDVAGKNVIIVDFSYKHKDLIALAEKATSVLVIDHHKTAMDDLMDMPQAELHYEAHKKNSTGKLHALFDMNRSGAGLAWEFFFPRYQRPALINHIEDRDLWQFKLEGTREIMAAIFSYPQDFAIWDQLFAADINALRRDGVAINRQHQKTVADLVRATKRRIFIGGHDVPVANLPYMYASDAGHLMTEGELFAASYFDTPDGRNFSLRSTDIGMDVSEIAKSYGGGGHRNAAGFKVPFDHELAFISTYHVLTCIYCGHEYPQGTPAAGHRVLTEHIHTCIKHPVHQAKQSVALLRAALAGLLGASTIDGLAELEEGMELIRIPETEKAIMISAIQALRTTHEQAPNEESQP